MSVYINIRNIKIGVDLLMVSSIDQCWFFFFLHVFRFGAE